MQLTHLKLGSNCTHERRGSSVLWVSEITTKERRELHHFYSVRELPNLAHVYK